MSVLNKANAWWEWEQMLCGNSGSELQKRNERSANSRLNDLTVNGKLVADAKRRLTCCVDCESP